jgi:hypothetical protein
VLPICPKCGFAGNSAAQAAAAGVPDASTEGWAKDDAQGVEWDTAPEGMGAEGAAPPAEAWAEATWPPADATEAPKKKGWFGRAK